MTTVKEFKDLGVEFVTDDKVQWRHGNMAGVISFAWRPLSTLPDDAKFKYELDFSKEEIRWRPSLDQSGAKDGEPTKPVFTQAMADMQHELDLHKANSELLATLTDFMVKNNIGKIGESCIDVAIRELSEKHNIDTRTPKQKAVDEMFDLWCGSGRSAKDSMEAIYDAGYRKQ